jgi:hypothetical protein
MKQFGVWEKIKYTLPWLPAYVWQRFVRHTSDACPVHLIIGVADHFEPMVRTEPGKPVGTREQERRLKTWCDSYPAAVRDWRDEEGQPLRHTYFYPAEDYDPSLIDRLAEHCHAGWGEIEVHLHHGVDAPDTKENTQRALVEFRDALVERGCLSRQDGAWSPRYAFVHGNWALANSDGGRFCGVDQEMQILADTGCYADFTLPAPSSAQIAKINSLYECALPLNQRAPHCRGLDLVCGREPHIFPLMIQGPLMINFARQKNRRWLPAIENGEVSAVNPPTLQRLQLWKDAAITVQGRPDWIFIKLHCHGMIPQDEPAMTGVSIRHFLRELIESPQNGVEYRLHFVKMREMVNIILAACDERAGGPGEYRDYRFQLINAPASK